MHSTQPLMNNPPFLFPNGPHTVNDIIPHFCLPYHCPCGPLKTCSRSNETTAGSEFIVEKELNDPLDLSTATQEESVEGDEYGLNNLFTTPNDFVTNATVNANLKMDDIINWDGVSPSSLTIPQAPPVPQMNSLPVFPGAFQPPTTLFPISHPTAPQSAVPQYQPVSHFGSHNNSRQLGRLPYQQMLRNIKRDRANALAESNQPPIETQPMYQQAFTFHSAVGPINNFQENMAGPTSVPEQYQIHMHYSQTMATPNGRAQKRSFENMVASDLTSTIAGPSKPPKRQHVYQFISVPQATLSTHQTVLSSPSTPNSSISEATAANKSPNKENKPAVLADYRRFLGSYYICNWETCTFRLSVDPHCEKREHFEKIISHHFQTHMPANKEFVCRWLGHGSTCDEFVVDERALIRHVYSIHQKSKGKCPHCEKPFSRAEQLNAHVLRKCRALKKLKK